MQHTMQAIEFESVVDGGVIRIPDSAKGQLEGKVKVIILSEGIAKLAKKAPKLGGWEGNIWMADDFDAPLEDFEEYAG